MGKTVTALLVFLFALSPAARTQALFRVMSYNVENLFDTKDNPATDDNEFLPSGSRRWSESRYYHKLQRIAKVIQAAGEWDTPALIGLCEVENDTVLTHLLTRTPLKHQSYRYCISESRDRRGINVALLYQRDRFGYIGHRSAPVVQQASGERAARDILHVWGRLATGDTLDVAVCHFPSKYGGEKESEGRRLDAAKTLRSLCDSLRHIRRTPHLLLMGDFNDPPESRCMRLVTGDSLVNLFDASRRLDPPGSHKYQGEWSRLDQIIVSPNLISGSSSLRLIPQSVRLFHPPFLLTKDKTWRGQRPKRTYYGFTHEAGYSDHLPVIADFSHNKKPLSESEFTE
ncbi:MAG: endonuclease [Tannerellaceae bacterium]|jgi:predicted extracellular nuclease|nr:endonuclease [Tannerellaceae bacterium]